MMKTIKMDDGWDIEVSNGKSKMVEGPNKHAQDISVLLKTCRGDNIFEPRMGIDWIYLIHYPSVQNIRSGIEDALSQYHKNIIIDRLDIREDSVTRRYIVKLDLIVDKENIDIEFIVGG